MQVLPEGEMVQDVLSHVRVGMPVFDRLNRRVGTVESVHLGNQSPAAFSSKLNNIVYTSKEVQTLLMQEGYIQINYGFQWHDLYATSEQITTVSEDRLQLKVGRSDLIVF